MIDSAVAGSAPFLPVRLVVFPEFAHAAPVFPTVQELLQKLTVPIPNEHTERLTAKGARTRPLHPERLDARRGSPMARRRVQHHMPHRARRHPVQIPEGESLDSLRSAHQPARSARLRRAAVSGRRHADRPHRLRDLLRLAVSGGDPAAGGERRRSAGARVGLHGSVGRDRADELVDGHQPRARDREHRVRRGRESGRQPAALSAVLVAGRLAGGRLRRPAPRERLARSRRADRRRADRHVGAAPRARDAAGAPHARPSSDRGVPGLSNHTAIRRV